MFPEPFSPAIDPPNSDLAAHLVVMAGAIVKRPGMFVGSPIRFDRITAFILGYSMAMEAVKDVVWQRSPNDLRPAGIESQFQDQLRQEGRLRWNRWDLTIAAEAIGWTNEEPPVIENFTEEEHLTAIKALEPLLEQLLALPKTIGQRSGHGMFTAGA